MENTNTITTTRGNAVELDDRGNLLTAAQRNRIDWLDAELYDGVVSVHVFDAGNLVGIDAGVAFVETGGHPEGRCHIIVNPLGGMSVTGSAGDLLGNIINAAPAL